LEERAHHLLRKHPPSMRHFIVVGQDPLILFLYVNDLFITGADRLLTSYKESLALEFEMTDIGLMHYFLRLEVW
jgi:hypothetical protein